MRQSNSALTHRPDVYALEFWGDASRGFLSNAWAALEKTGECARGYPWTRRAPRGARFDRGAGTTVAIYHLHVKNISRRDGRSAVAAAAYRAGETLWNEAEEKESAFGGKRDVVASEIRLPAGAPAWMAERGRLWNAVEAGEKRKDARLAKEIEFSLPRELPTAVWLDVARQMADVFVARGHVVDLAIHEDGAGHNPHVHLLLATRSVAAEGFGLKIRESDAHAFVTEARKTWTSLANAALGKVGYEAQIDDRSNAARGIARPPTKHRGPDPAERRARRWERTMDHDTLEARRELLAEREVRERYPLLSARPDWPPEQRSAVGGLNGAEREEWQRFWREVDQRRWEPEVTDRRAPDFDEARVHVERGDVPVLPESTPSSQITSPFTRREIEQALPVWRELREAVLERLRAEGFDMDDPGNWRRVASALREMEGKIQWLYTLEAVRDAVQGPDQHPDPNGRPISGQQLDSAERDMLDEHSRATEPALQPDRLPAAERANAANAVQRANAIEISDREVDDYRLAPHESRLDWLEMAEASKDSVREADDNRLDWLGEAVRGRDGSERDRER